MKNLIVILAVFCFVISGVSWAESLKVKEIGEGTYSLQARDKSEGKGLWQSTVRVEKKSDETGTFIVIKENGEGIYGKDKKYKIWEAESYTRLEGERLIPYQTNLIFRDAEGNVVSTVKKLFSRERKEVICEVDNKIERFSFKDDLLDREILGVALAGFPFEERKEISFHLLTHEPDLYGIKIENRGKEALMVGDGSIECYKLEMIPDLGPLSFLGGLVPKNYFWYTAAVPHELIRYEGLESGLRTSNIILEVSTED